MSKLYHSVVYFLIYIFAKYIGSIWFYGVHKKNTVEHDVDGFLCQFLVPGRIILTKTKGAMSDFMIPGDWTHGLIYAGMFPVIVNGAVKMIHMGIEATTGGVKFSYISDIITHCDNYAVMEVKGMTPGKGAAIVFKAKQFIGRPYDFSMVIDENIDDSDTTKKVFCTEVVYKSVNYAFPKLLELRVIKSIPTFTPQDCYNARSKINLIAQKVNGVKTVF